jgi:hypothetical protein
MRLMGLITKEIDVGELRVPLVAMVTRGVYYGPC